MFYSNDTVEELRLQNDIVDVVSTYVNLKQKGGNYFGLCPFHNEKSPSFSVNRERQMYHCFGCGASGNVYGFVMQVENINFVEAIKLLADRVNYSLPVENFSEEYKMAEKLKNVIYEINKIAAKFFFENLGQEQSLVCRSYLAKRKLTRETIRKFGLGFSEGNGNRLIGVLKEKGYTDSQLESSGFVKKNEKGLKVRFFNRLMFPIIEPSGKIIAFGGRVIGTDGEPKYLNSPETPVFNKSHSLFNLNFAKKSGKDEYIIVEGYMDAITLYQSGFENVVATLGTALNVGHARLLKRYVNSVILLFDSDTAGTKAALRAIPILRGIGLSVKILQVNDAKDPDEYLKKFGHDAFSKLLEESLQATEFQIRLLLKKYDIQNNEQKLKFIQESSAVINDLESFIERDLYLNEIAELTGLDVKAIKNEIEKVAQLPQNAKTNIMAKNKLNNKAISVRYKNLLNMCIKDSSSCKMVMQYLTADEIDDEVARAIFTLVFAAANSNKPIYEAKILDSFETSEEQKKAAYYLEDADNVVGDFNFSGFLNDSIKNIKLKHIDTLKDIATKNSDFETLKSLVESRKNVDALNITGLDG